MTTRRLDLVDLVRELTQTTQHREFYMRKRKPRYHTTTNQPLLVQLLLTAYPSNTQTEGAGKIPSSRPTANVDAIDEIRRIRTEAGTWLRSLGYDDTGRIVQVVRRLAALTPSQDHCGRTRPTRDQAPPHPVTCCTYHRIEADIRRWWIHARITTGWDLPPWRPRNTCPLCGYRGSLRVRAAEKLASCTYDDCRATWDDTTFGLLVEHIRTENGEQQAS